MVVAAWVWAGSAGASSDSAPVLLSSVEPVYPVTELLTDRQGSSVIDYTIAEDGSTRDFAVVVSDVEQYAGHAIDAVREWRYRPAIRDGRPVAVRVRHRFVYRLR